VQREFKIFSLPNHTNIFCCRAELFVYIHILITNKKLKVMTREQIEQNFVIKSIKDTNKETIYTIELPNNDGEAKIMITKPQVRMYGNFVNVIQKYEHLIR